MSFIIAGLLAAGIGAVAYLEVAMMRTVSRRAVAIGLLISASLAGTHWLGW